MVAQHCECIKCHWIVHFKRAIVCYVNFNPIFFWMTPSTPGFHTNYLYGHRWLPVLPISLSPAAEALTLNLKLPCKHPAPSSCFPSSFALFWDIYLPEKWCQSWCGIWMACAQDFGPYFLFLDHAPKKQKALAASRQGFDSRQVLLRFYCPAHEAPKGKLDELLPQWC